eukprot:scaffold2105_cov62-Phaeocystis_antarctica.AAC.2
MHTAAGAGTGERMGTGQAVREAVREAAQLQRRCRGGAEEEAKGAGGGSGGCGACGVVPCGAVRCGDVCGIIGGRRGGSRAAALKAASMYDLGQTMAGRGV